MPVLDDELVRERLAKLRKRFGRGRKFLAKPAAGRDAANCAERNIAVDRCELDMCGGCHSCADELAHDRGFSDTGGSGQECGDGPCLTDAPECAKAAKFFLPADEGSFLTGDE